MLPLDNDLKLHKFGNDGKIIKIDDQKLKLIKLSNNENISGWGVDNYLELMKLQSEEMGYKIEDFAKLYSICTLPYIKEKNKGWFLIHY